MCVQVSLEEEEEHGTVWTLCDTYRSHLLDEIPITRPRGVVDTVWDSLLAAFASAKAVVLEQDYFDLDYRSEFSGTHETTFQRRIPTTRRLHFFDAKPPSPGTHLYDAVAGMSKGYLGYSIICPGNPQRVGRSIVSTSAAHPDLQNQTGIGRYVRTSVSEAVNVFGVGLSAVGVPFMEQDGHLLRCAHVAAWMCHYTSVLRGLVPRRTTLRFHRAEGVSSTLGRSYPSDGLTTDVLSQVLRRLDLPPEIVPDVALRHPRQVRWHDRERLHDLAAGTSDESQRFWAHENLTAHVCRYLNSGFPTILCEEEAEHARVIVGYVRADSFRSGHSLYRQPESGRIHSDVAAFLVSDDARGPLEIVSVDELVDQVVGDYDWQTTLVTPLPHGLWLSGAKAETAGAGLLGASAVLRRQADWSEWWETQVGLGHAAHDGPDLAERQRVLTRFAEVVAGGNLAERPIGVRSYAAFGSDLKVGLIRRLDDSNASRVLGRTRMPKFVWVVEAVDRKLRSIQSEHVIATAILDASMHVDDHTPMDIGVLGVHLPGQLYDPSRAGLEDPSSWIPTHLNPYGSGRWNDADDGVLSTRATAGRAKLATARELST